MAAAMADEPHSFEESPLETLISGTFSSVGRKTRPRPHMLRGAFPEFAGPVQCKSSALGLSMSSSQMLLAKGIPSPTSQADAGLDMSVTLFDGAASPTHGDSQEDISTKPVSQPALGKSGTTSFTSLGQDRERFCGQASSQYRRFAAPARMEKPDLGQYKASHAITLERAPSWEIGTRPRTVSRKPAEETRDFDRSMSSSSPALLRRTSKPESSLSPTVPKRVWDSVALKGGTADSESLKRKLDPMSLSSERPSLWKLCNVQNNDGIGVTPTDDLHRTFEKAAMQRQAVYDFSKWTKRANLPTTTGCKYFEAGKYEVKYGVVNPAVKEGAPFQHHILTYAGSRDVPKALLVPDDGKSGLAPDRSMYRSALLARPRITHTSDFTKDLERPPLIKPGETYYDQDDPAACQMTLERELNFDASTVDHAVTSRRDYAPDMARSLRRDKAGVGARAFQDDSAMRSSKGFGVVQTTIEFGSVESCKENPNRENQDTLVAMHRVKGRSREESEIQSPQHRRVAVPFERKANAGFRPRTSISTPVKRAARAHEALPDWSPASLEHD